NIEYSALDIRSTGHSALSHAGSLKKIIPYFDDNIGFPTGVQDRSPAHSALLEYQNSPKMQTARVVSDEMEQLGYNLKIKINEEVWIERKKNILKCCVVEMIRPMTRELGFRFSIYLDNGGTDNDNYFKIKGERILLGTGGDCGL
ncbi:hypothetical protein ACJX0J_009094, partial [Zea mays]